MTMLNLSSIILSIKLKFRKILSEIYDKSFERKIKQAPLKLYDPVQLKTVS